MPAFRTTLLEDHGEKPINFLSDFFSYCMVLEDASKQETLYSSYCLHLSKCVKIPGASLCHFILQSTTVYASDKQQSSNVGSISRFHQSPTLNCGRLSKILCFLQSVLLSMSSDVVFELNQLYSAVSTARKKTV